MARRVIAVVMAAAALAALVVPVADAEDAPAEQLLDACEQHQDEVPTVPGVVTPGPAACRTATQVVWGAARACRAVVADAPEQCEPLDGRDISPADLAAYEASWVHHALTLQRGLDLAAPLFESLLLHTHNSFNSSAYDPTLTNLDPNQAYSMTDQLRMDVRLIEIDLHWVPSVHGNASTGGNWVTLCHGDSDNDLGVHVGCTNDRPFEDGLAEIRAWLDANPNEFVVVYLENQLSGSEQAHAVAAQLIEDAVGDLVERPAAPCADMDWSRTRASKLDAGHRVVFVGDCGAGGANAWGATVFQRGAMWDESGEPDGYSPTSPSCAADMVKHDGGTFRRYFEDSTLVGAMAGSSPHTSSFGGTTVITPEQATAMVACGVNLVGLDQLTPADPRLPALVWSWAPGEPSVSAAGTCAVHGGDGRFRAASCRQRRHFACLDDAGHWRVTTAARRWAGGSQACAAEFPGSRFAVPVNGYRNAQLVQAKAAIGEVWVDYAATDTGWHANRALR